MKYKKISIWLGMVMLVVSMSGCSLQQGSGSDSGNETVAETNASETGSSGDGTQNIGGSSTNNASDGDKSAQSLEMFTNRDKEIGYDESTAVKITLADSGSASDSSNVKIDGDTITITGEGTYLLTGSLSNGQIVVDASDSDKVQIVLDNVSINCNTSAAIYVKEADKVFLTLAAGSQNTLKNAQEFVAIDDNNIDAVIFSKSDLTLNGNGTLTVNAVYGHGIVSKDDLKITSGTYQVTAEKSALNGKDSVRIADGVFELKAGSDGIHSENEEDEEKGYIYIAGGNFTITASSDGMDSSGTTTIAGGTFNISTDDDGIHASTDLIINNGTITVVKSYEGLEGKTITVNGGEIRVKASDDGLNAAGGKDQSSTAGGRGGRMEMFSSGTGVITINGGSIYVDADGDGIDSNGSLTINGGEILVSGPTNSGNGALDYDTNAVITGGSIIALGSSGMAQNFGTDSTQGSILVNLQSIQQAGTQVSLKNSSGTVIAEFTAEKTFNSVLISCPEIKQGENYTLTVGSTDTSITMDSLIYGSGMGMGGFGGQGGMPGGDGNFGGRGGFGGEGGMPGGDGNFGGQGGFGGEGGMPGGDGNFEGGNGTTGENGNFGGNMGGGRR